MSLETYGHKTKHRILGVSDRDKNILYFQMSPKVNEIYYFFKIGSDNCSDFIKIKGQFYNT